MSKVLTLRGGSHGTAPRVVFTTRFRKQSSPSAQANRHNKREADRIIEMSVEAELTDKFGKKK